MMRIWSQYECPFCGGPAWRGDPRTGMNFRGSARCDDCKRGFAAIGMKPVGQVEWPEPVPTESMLEWREKIKKLDAFLGIVPADPSSLDGVVFDDRFEELHPRGERGAFASHASFMKKAVEAADRALVLDQIPPEKATAFREALHAIFRAAPAGVMKKISERVERWHFRATTQDMDRTFRRMSSKDVTLVAAFIHYRPDGKLEVYLDGGHDVGDRSQEGGSGKWGRIDPKDTLAANYGHEMGHVLDGVKQDGSDFISHSPQWRAAWKKEIDGPYGVTPISITAQGSPTEGWAEFTRLVLFSKRQARKKFPLCWDVWKKRHLV